MFPLISYLYADLTSWNREKCATRFHAEHSCSSLLASFGASMEVISLLGNDSDSNSLPHDLLTELYSFWSIVTSVSSICVLSSAISSPLGPLPLALP